MNELTSTWDDRDKLIFSNELEKLFVLQDRPLSKEKKSILVDEISLHGFPLQPLILGLRKLMGEDLKVIKKATIIEAAMEFIVNVGETVPCDYCSDGYIIAKDQEGRYMSLACTCPNGKRRKIAKWNGEETQILPAQTYELNGVPIVLEDRLVKIQVPI